jgi:hypothetical protein
MKLDVFGAHVPQAKDDDTRQVRPTGGQEIAKVEIMSQKDESFLAGLLQDCLVIKSTEAQRLKMHCLMTQTLQEVHGARGDTHVDQELHVEACSKGWMVSCVSHAAYRRACRISSGSKQG